MKSLNRIIETAALQIKIHSWLAPSILFLIAFSFRIFHLDFSFSNDELSAILRTQQPNFNSLLQYGIRVDGHPAGVEVFLYYWIKLVGTSEFFVRLPFALFGSIAVVFAFLFAKERIGFQAAFFTGISLSLLQFPLLYSQQARPYASGMMLAMMLAWIWSKIVGTVNSYGKIKICHGLLFALLLALNAYNHYFSALLASIIFISGFFYLSKKYFLAYSIYGALAVLLFIPHLGISLQQFSYKGVGEWLAKPNASFLLHHLLIIFNGSLLYLVIILVITSINNTGRKAISIKNKERVLLLLWFLIPIIVGYLYSIYRNPVLQDRVLIFSMPFLFMFLFSWVSSKSIAMQLLQYILLFFTLVIALWHSNYYKESHFINFKEIALRSNNTHNHYAKKSLLSIEQCNTIKYLQFYLRDSSYQFDLNEVSNDTQLMQLHTLLDTSTKTNMEYIVLKPQNKIALMMLHAQFPKQLISYSKGENCAYYLFSKSKQQISLQKDSNSIYFYKLRSDSVDISGLEYYNIIDYKALSNGFYTVYLKYNFNGSKERFSSSLVVSILRNNKTIYWYSIPLKYFYHRQQWSPFYYQEEIELQTGDHLKAYLWNSNKGTLKLKKVQVKLNHIFQQSHLYFNNEIIPQNY